MKKIMSVILAAALMLCSLSIGFTANAEPEITISAGESLDLTVDGEEGKMIAFNPDETGVYRFFSTGELDTMAAVFYDEGVIAFGDDTGDPEEPEDYNFCFSCYCEAGVNYTIHVMVYENIAEGETTLNVEKLFDVESIAFEQKKPYEYIEGTEPMFEFNNGDKIIVSCGDGEKTEYVYTGELYDFVDENEESITQVFSDFPMVDGIYDEETDDFTGSVCVWFLNKEFEAEMITVENPVEDIAYELKEPIVIVENTHGELFQFSKKDKAFYYDMPEIYDEGNRLTVYYKNGEVITYTCTLGTEYDEEYGEDITVVTFVDKNGNELDMRYLNEYETQEETHWTLGTNSMYISYMGVETEIPVEIIKAGWYRANGKTYYYNEDGEKLTGVQRIDNKTYVFAFADGRLLSNMWVSVNGKKYYLGKDGVALTYFKNVNGKYYYFNGAGVMYKGWLTISGKRYYFGNDGAYVYRKKIGNYYYYFNGAGVMQKGWIKGGVWMYGDLNSGALKTGWFKVGGKWYWFKADGTMVTGWQKIGGKWYYFNSSGSMRTANLTYKGKVYRFNSSGACINP